MSTENSDKIQIIKQLFIISIILTHVLCKLLRRSFEHQSSMLCLMHVQFMLMIKHQKNIVHNVILCCTCTSYLAYLARIYMSDHNV